MQEQPRFFTFEEATKTLPLVTRIVHDIMETYPAMQQRMQRFHQLAAAGGLPGDTGGLEELRAEVDGEAERLNGFVRELEQIGCRLKGFEDGRVDFQSFHHGRPIFLCWKFGQERIDHWYESESDYGGSQPLTPEMIREIREELPTKAARGLQDS